MKTVTFCLLIALSITGPASRNVASLVTSKAIVGVGLSATLARHSSFVETVLRPAMHSGDPDAARRAHLAVGLLDERTGNQDGAVQEWRLAGAGALWEHTGHLLQRRQDLIGARIFYRRAIYTDASKIDNYFTLAWVEWPGLGRPQEAIEVYQEAAQLLPVDSFERPMVEGYIFRIRQDWPRALESFEEAAAIDPTSADAHRQAALAAAGVGKYPIAVEHLRRAIAATPEDSAIYVELGDLYRTIGRDPVSIYTRALQVDPGNMTARHRLEHLKDEQR